MVQTTSRRLADRKVERFEKNITKRGTVPETTIKKGKDYPVGPILLGFFIFVVIGSCMSLPSYCSFDIPWHWLLMLPEAVSILQNDNQLNWLLSTEIQVRVSNVLVAFKSWV